MSRSFEILEQAGQTHDLLRVPPPMASQPFRDNETFRDLTSEGCQFNNRQLHRLVQQLFFAHRGSKDGDHNVTFCAVDHGSGSSKVCAQAARILAEQVNSPICLVDATAEGPFLSTMFPQPPSGGINSEFEASGIAGERQLLANLWLVGVSLPSVGGATTLENARRLLECLRQRFSYILISAPPLTTHSDGILFAHSSDGIVLVVEAGRTRRTATNHVVQELTSAGTAVLGIVLNNRTFPVPEWLYRVL